MKRLFCSVLILLLTAGGAALCTLSLDGRIRHYEEETEKCMAYCVKGNEAAAVSVALEMESEYERDRRLFNAFFNHNDVQQLFYTLPLLTVYAADGTDTLYEKCAECRNMLSIIRRTLYPHFDTIL